ncbi:MAG: hypothetical protein HPY89_08980 [Pelotomaculum sp.]|nr:hypothetical protein [Pelotomaculum sp.]
MKKSQQILGLPVLSIEEGKQIGAVKHLVLSPENGAVKYILVEDDAWYSGFKAVPFEKVLGIGEFGLTVESRSSLSAVTDMPEAVELLKKDIRLPGIRVLSKKGRLVGTVGDFIVDERTAEIAGCQLIPAGGEKTAGVIPRKLILTFGRDFLVVEEGTESMLVSDVQETFQDNAYGEEAGRDRLEAHPDAPAATAQSTPVAENKEQPLDVLEHFEEQQRKYILGKKVTMRIVADSGEVIAEEGSIVTDEMIERAKATNTYLRLTLNIRD